VSGKTPLQSTFQGTSATKNNIDLRGEKYGRERGRKAYLLRGGKQPKEEVTFLSGRGTGEGVQVMWGRGGEKKEDAY